MKVCNTSRIDARPVFASCVRILTVGVWITENRPALIEIETFPALNFYLDFSAACRGNVATIQEHGLAVVRQFHGISGGERLLIKRCGRGRSRTKLIEVKIERTIE